MKPRNVIKEKSYNFSLKVVETYKYLVEKRKEFVLSKQLLRSGTSIGANVHESLGSHSKKEFVSKMAIAHKEALETKYWIELLKDSGFIDSPTYSTLISDCVELIKILVSIQKSSKK